jgi:hypothetical protein
MHDREPVIMQRLLDRLVAARRRRDREERYSAAWHQADAEMHAIERAIFRVPVEHPAPAPNRPPEAPTPLARRARERGRRRYESERVG